MIAFWSGSGLHKERKVSVITTEGVSAIVFDNSSGSVNIHIDTSVVRDAHVRECIKLYVAFFFVNNKELLLARFSAVYGLTLQVFAKRHGREICEVIYYLEHEEHGNLPIIYGRDAYRLLDIVDLTPYIQPVRKKLYGRHMLLIDREGQHGDIEAARFD